mmetsp:Transcript_21812/g.34190  ORF Transcript_21812/g.34190 Transcript_21812/m.34190 type:complete len:178 (-) Transcript_21812:2028-2561(-)
MLTAARKRWLRSRPLSRPTCDSVSERQQADGKGGEHCRDLLCRKRNACIALIFCGSHSTSQFCSSQNSFMNFSNNKAQSNKGRVNSDCKPAMDEDLFNGYHNSYLHDKLCCIHCQPSRQGLHSLEGSTSELPRAILHRGFADRPGTHGKACGQIWREQLSGGASTLLCITLSAAEIV